MSLILRGLGKVIYGLPDIIPHSPQKNVENQASQRFFIENERNNKQIERNELKNKGSKL